MDEIFLEESLNAARNGEARVADHADDLDVGDIEIKAEVQRLLFGHWPEDGTFCGGWQAMTGSGSQVQWASHGMQLGQYSSVQSHGAMEWPRRSSQQEQRIMG